VPNLAPIPKRPRSRSPRKANPEVSPPTALHPQAVQCVQGVVRALLGGLRPRRLLQQTEVDA
jgi:hypothetical protein